MSAIIIDGKEIALQVRTDVAKRVEKLRARGLVPALAVVLVGEDPASVSYVTAKERALEQAGMASQDIRLPIDTSETELLAIIDSLNKNTDIHGILVQLPVPKHIDESKLIRAIDPSKDVDGFHPGVFALYAPWGFGNAQDHAGKDAGGPCRSNRSLKYCGQAPGKPTHPKRGKCYPYRLPYGYQKCSRIYPTGRYFNCSSRKPRLSYRADGQTWGGGYRCGGE